MTNEQLITMILSILAAGSGVVIQFLYNQYLEARKEKGTEVSPKTKRRVAFLLCLLVPSGLYAAALGIAYIVVYPLEYSLGAHAGYIFAAFTAMQLWHGETKLPSGKDLERATLDKFAGNRPEDS